MGVGTHLERFAAKFCAEPRRERPDIFCGDPFGDILVPVGVGQDSEKQNFTFFHALLIFELTLFAMFVNDLDNAEFVFKAWFAPVFD